MTDTEREQVGMSSNYFDNYWSWVYNGLNQREIEEAVEIYNYLKDTKRYYTTIMEVREAARLKQIATLEDQLAKLKSKGASIL